MKNNTIQTHKPLVKIFKSEPNKSKNIHQEITNMLIKKMKAGELLWRKGYTSLLAQNWVSKANYSGINYLLLNFVFPHPTCPYFATFKQISKMGGSVKKGTKGIKIIYYQTHYKKDGKYVNSEKVKAMSKAERNGLEKFHTLKYYYVHNMMNTENVKNFDYEKWGTSIPETPKADEAILKNLKSIIALYKDGPIIIPGQINAYFPRRDEIKHIHLAGWSSINEFACTMLHEMIHSTGHSRRLARFEATTFPKFGSPDYAQEELIAELGAAMLCNHIGIFPDTSENSAAYLQSWIKVLEDDEKLIFKASAKAQKAMDYILGNL